MKEPPAPVDPSLSIQSPPRALAQPPSARLGSSKLALLTAIDAACANVASALKTPIATIVFIFLLDWVDDDCENYRVSNTKRHFLT